MALVVILVIIVLIGGHGNDHAVAPISPSYFGTVQLEATERHNFGVRGSSSLCFLSV